MVQAREFKHDTREGILVNAVSKMWINWLLSKWIRLKSIEEPILYSHNLPSPHIFSFLLPVTSLIMPLCPLWLSFPRKSMEKNTKHLSIRGVIVSMMCEWQQCSGEEDEEKRVCNLMVSYSISDAFLTSHINDTSALFEYDTSVSNFYVNPSKLYPVRCDEWFDSWNQTNDLKNVHTSQSNGSTLL